MEEILPKFYQIENTDSKSNWTWKDFEVLTPMHGREVVLVLEHGSPASVILSLSLRLHFLFVLRFLHALHGFETRFPCRRVRGPGHAGDGRHHGALLTLYHFQVFVVVKRLSGWTMKVHCGRGVAQGTWCNCVRTVSSSLFPEFPRRLPLAEFRLLSRLSLFWSLIVSWSRMITLFMDTCVWNGPWEEINSLT